MDPPFVVGFNISNKYFITNNIVINNNEPKNNFTKGLFNQSLLVSTPISVTIWVVSSDEPTGWQSMYMSCELKLEPLLVEPLSL